MKKIALTMIALVSFSILGENSYAEIKNNKTKTNSTIKKNTVEENEESNFKPNFIKAADLLKRIQKKEKFYIFDVRGKVAYEEGHIIGALEKDLPITSEAVKDVPKDAQIVTYCGCPHHLSSIGAEQLTNMGYKNVRVLDEGYNYWKDQKYPLDRITKSPVTQLSVSGVLLKNKKPVPNVDIYMKHESTGQMEATRTAKDGSYKMHWHLYNYKDNDKFKFYVKDLKTPVQDFSTKQKENKNVIVNMK